MDCAWPEYAATSPKQKRAVNESLNLKPATGNNELIRTISSILGHRQWTYAKLTDGIVIAVSVLKCSVNGLPFTIREVGEQCEPAVC